MSNSARCPKRMEFGPCGGVRVDLSCEMVAAPCPFAQLDAPVPWVGPTPPSRIRPRLLDVAASRPVVLTDLTLQPFDAQHVVDMVGILAGSCDGLLIGEHQNRPDFPPSVLAELVRSAGGNAWITLTCRDRNRIVLQQELAGLAQISVDGVLCVTGDGRAHGVRPDVTQVFDLDGTRLAALAAGHGLAVAVAEAPAAAPRALRPARLREKQRAGAQLAILNHVGSVHRLADFVAAARAAGVTLPLIAGVALYTDERSAAVLQNFPGLHLDRGQVDAVLGAADPVAAGLATAVAEAREVLSIDGVVGVNLSGLASGRGERFGAQLKAAVGREIIGPVV